METLHYTLPEFKLSEPGQALLDFCGRYPQSEAQQLLWKWFILALKDSRTTNNNLSNTEIMSFYEDLKTLVSAVYQLHELPGEATSPQLPQEVLPANASLAAALDILHATVSPNWVLLVCPPEECQAGPRGGQAGS